MKYSLMSITMGNDFKLTKPTVIHKLMARNMGFEFDEGTTLEEFEEFYVSRGMPFKNGDMSIEDFVKFSKDKGFQAVDMMEYHLELPGTEVKKILEKYDMVLSSVNILVDFADADTDEKFKEAFDFAKTGIDKAADAGCKSVLLVPAALSLEPGISREEAYENIIKGLSSCLEYAMPKGVEISVEPHHCIWTPLCSIAELKLILEALPALTYTHDTGNMLPMLENPVIAYDMFKDRVTALHMKDFVMVGQGQGYLCVNGKYLTKVPFGEGIVDHRELFRHLIADKFDGFIALEGTGKSTDRNTKIIEAFDYLKNLEEEVWAEYNT